MAEKNIPEIRFDGFSDNWVTKKLKDLTEASFSNGVFNDPSKVGQGYRLINVKDMYVGNSIDVESLSLVDIDKKEFLKNKVEYGDIFFTRSSLVKEGIAYSNVNLSDHQGLTYDGHLIRMQPCKKLTTPLFLASLFKTSSARKQFIVGGKTTTMTTIGQTDIAEVKVTIPLPNEQTKIGTYFQQLDSLITHHQQKHDKLLNLKKAMLEKMFPKKGADIPDIRFKGFSEKWEEKELGEIGSVVMNKRIFKEETLDEGEVPFYKIGTFGSKPDAFISRELFEKYKSKYPFPEKGDLLISASGSIGRIVEYMGKDEYFQDSNIVWLRHDGRIINSFLKQFYSIVKWSGLEGSTIQRLYNKNILETGISLPIQEEQTKIGNFFKNLDHLLTLQQTQLEKLKNIKKSCLEKMFV